MENLNIFTELLKKIEIIRFKYEKLYQADNFNIFSILRNEDDEVNLHSAFLFELLNPKSKHNHGIEFLKLFINEIGIHDFEFKDVIVKKEYKNIDIFISNKSQSVVIENKIYAEDQPNQIERYYEKTKESKPNVRVVYLNLDGTDPSKYSLGKYKESYSDFLIVISYHTTILSWLDKCLKEVATEPLLRETIVQYQYLLKKLTGQSSIQRHDMDLKELLKKNNNMKLAYDIVRSWDGLKIDIQFDFWSDLEKIIEERGFTIVPLQKYSKSKVTKFVLNSRNNKYFGIMFKLKKLSNTEDICLYIEVDNNIFYGVTVVETNGKRDMNDSSKYNSLYDKIKNNCSVDNRNNRWIGWKYPEERINFKTFNSPLTFSLSNEEKRINYIKSLLNEIVEFVDSCNF